MGNKELSKKFWAVFGMFNIGAVLYLLKVSQPESDDARFFAATMLVGAILALALVDAIAVSVAYASHR